MLPPNRFKGIWTALVTPFATDGSVDWSSFDQILDRQVCQGIAGVVVGETTGESLSLSSHEKLALVRRAKARSLGKKAVMAGMSGSNTQQVRELARLYQDAGADSLLVLTPPFVQPSLSGLVKHFEMITEDLDIGVFVHYSPRRCGLKLQSHELSELLALRHVVGFKDDSSDFSLLNQLRRKTEKLLLSGDENSILGAISQGADGAISLLSHLFPNVVADIYENLLKFDLPRAQELYFALRPLLEALSEGSNPQAIKACLAYEGLIQNELRLPLDALKGQAFDKIITQLNDTKILLKGASHA